MAYINNNKQKYAVALTAIIIVGAFLFVSLWDFLPAFLGAIIFFIICSPLKNYLVDKKKWNRVFSVIVVLILSFLVLLTPIMSLTWLLVSRISDMLSNTQALYSQIQSFNDLIHQHLGVNILTHDNLSKIGQEVTKFIPGFLGETFSIAVNILIMYFILFYLLYSKADIEKQVIDFLPYENENAALFTKELISQTYSNAIGVPVIAILQGGLSTLGFWIFGLKDPLFWGVVCGLFSFLPLAGTPLIWVPAGIFQMSSGEPWQGIGILIYGSVVIVGFDHLFRFVIQKKIASVHPLITLFGFIIGLHWFGLPGLIFGPLLISYFLIMMKVYKKEYGRKLIFLPDSSDKTNVPSGDLTLK